MRVVVAIVLAVLAGVVGFLAGRESGGVVGGQKGVVVVEAAETRSGVAVEGDGKRSVDFEELVALLGGVGEDDVRGQWRVKAILRAVESGVLEGWLAARWAGAVSARRWKARACCGFAFEELVRRNGARARGFVDEQLELTGDDFWRKTGERIGEIEEELGGPVGMVEVTGESDEKVRWRKMRRWVEDDPEGALAWVVENQGEAGGGWTAGGVGDRAAWGNPEMVLEGIEDAGVNERSRFVYLSAARVLAVGDPEGAVERFSAMGERNEVEEKALQVALQTWAERDVDAVVDYLAGLDDEEAGRLLMGTFGVSGYSASGGGVTSAFSGGFFGENRYRSLAKALGENLLGRPEVIGGLMERFGGTEAGGEFTNAVLENLAVTDPEGALALALGSEGDGNTRSDRVVSVVRAVVENDAERALELVMGVGAGETGRINGLSRIGAHLGENDPVAGVAMLERLEGRERDTFFESLNFEVAKRDPYRASEFFDVYVGEGSGGGTGNLESHAWQVAGSLVRVDPPRALEWAAGLPGGKVRERALREVREEWGELDADALAGKERELGISD